jgi:hypothetical protein
MRTCYERNRSAKLVAAQALTGKTSGEIVVRWVLFDTFECQFDFRPEVVDVVIEYQMISYLAAPTEIIRRVFDILQ